jgi:hypothetical protein
VIAPNQDGEFCLTVYIPLENALVVAAPVRISMVILMYLPLPATLAEMLAIPCAQLPVTAKYFFLDLIG